MQEMFDLLRQKRVTPLNNALWRHNLLGLSLLSIWVSFLFAFSQWL